MTGSSPRVAVLNVILAAALLLSGAAVAQDAARIEKGSDAWNEAACYTCHGENGQGGAGGEFPAGPNLRRTRLDRDGLAETISCGRPNTKMPGWLDGAYRKVSCFDLPLGAPPEGTVLTEVLDADQIQALLDYLLAKIVGK